MGSSQRRQVARDLRTWTNDGQPAVLATVVATSDSAPRGVGAQLAVTTGGLWSGALSGGCAEAEVLAIASELLELSGDGADRAARHTTLTRETLGAGGPMCGATLDVVLERVDAALLAALEASSRPTSTMRMRRTWVAVDGAAGAAGALIRAELDLEPALDGSTHVFASGDDELELEEIVTPAPRLVVAGAGDVAAELLRHAEALGWRTLLLDPRGPFVELTLRGASADEVVQAWPEHAGDRLGLDSRDACVAAAHHDRIDEPFLELALTSDAFYVASIGSRVVQHARREVLSAKLGEAALARHHGPAGLNLGGSDAAEIALSIMAEAVACSNGRDGSPLTSSIDPIRAR